ncbi:uncharacterized protein BXZ73DRAFT_74707 [Epithele typhae]|uniref:uncharacterized protein n=1 Tax=Epithele typhae TaxID=378194 RepID=UPI002007E02F|nr:uncharacterized protein BXZ73DRAFT_74707 [Epithele typhae]KAH9942451.1 hypothetical protein BXZ73DRAFT_74707 [Epithele typhae]
MFSRGSRFPSNKPSEVPGPGTYDVQDPEYDAYKRGAFLEKTNRFNKDKPSDVPGPGVYDTEPPSAQNRPPTRNAHNTTATDRLAVLQRKLEDLERIHVEEKKAVSPRSSSPSSPLNQVFALAAPPRPGAAQARAQPRAAHCGGADERAEKLKRQTDALDARVQELKRTGAAETAELREARAKLRTSEHERTQLLARLGEAKAEARRREDAKERERRVGELEKALAAERKKREAAEERARRRRGRRRRGAGGAEAGDGCARGGGERAGGVGRGGTRGGAAGATRATPLERKLGNSDGQVVELAHLIRQVKEERAFLAEQLERPNKTWTHSDWPYAKSKARRFIPATDLTLDLQTILRLGVSLRPTSKLGATSIAFRLPPSFITPLSSPRKRTTAARSSTGMPSSSPKLPRSASSCPSSFSRHKSSELTPAYARGHDCVARRSSGAGGDGAKRARACADREPGGGGEGRGSPATRAAGRTRASAALAHAKQAEQFLQSEVEQLSADLADAERYQHAYETLIAEVDALVEKNELAEEEAKRLSKFNAEIVGHNNPAQRIQYVDRIRRELHETKQKLLTSTRDRDLALVDNDGLRAELGLYKSVAVPQDAKPRTTITRSLGSPFLAIDELVATATLVWWSEGELGSAGSSVSRGAGLTSVPEMDGYLPEDMTLDELN